MKVMLIVLLLVGFPSAMQAGEERMLQLGFEGPQITDKKEKFFGATNLMLGGLQFGAAGLDLKTTFDCVGRSRTVIESLPNGGRVETTYTCVETNSRMAQSIADGWGPASARIFAYNAPIWVGGHYLRRSDKKFFRIMGWALPILATGWQLKTANDNRNITKQFP